VLSREWISRLNKAAESPFIEMNQEKRMMQAGFRLISMLVRAALKDSIGLYILRHQTSKPEITAVTPCSHAWSSKRRPFAVPLGWATGAILTRRTVHTWESSRCMLMPNVLRVHNVHKREQALDNGSINGRRSGSDSTARVDSLYKMESVHTLVHLP
jgi:hypothetical protein